MNAELLRTLLAYDPATGLFTWLYRPEGNNENKRWNTRYAGKPAGSLSPQGYIIIKYLGRFYKAHRLAWLYVHGEWPDGDLDHKDTYRANNRFDNLRPTTGSQNHANRPIQSNNTSGYKGVSWDKTTSKWRASIRNGLSIHLGLYDEPEHAAAAYRIAAAYIFGQFARSK